MKIQMDPDLENLPAFEETPIEKETAILVQDTPLDLAKIEGSLQYVNAGYDIPYYWSFGPAGIKTFAKRVVRKFLKCLIPPILERQNRFNLHVVNCLNAVKTLFIQTNTQTEEIASLKKEMSSYREETTKRIESLQEIYIRKIENQIRSLQELQTEETTRQIEFLRKTYIEEIENRIRRLQEIQTHETTNQIESLRGTYIEDLEKQAGTLQEMMRLIEQKASAQQVSNIEGRIGALQHKTENLDRQSDAFSASVAKMLLQYRRNEGSTVGQENTEVQSDEKKADVSDNIYTILDYFKFQNDFRGTRSVIAERQKIYLPYFQNCTGPVIDIGCGRGEFLRLMKDNHIPAFGIDLYPEYEVEGELYGLDIRQGNGIEFVKNSELQFGGIFAAQVIEHISFSELQDLCAAAYKKLVPGAYLVMETPNPTCLSMFTSSFYIDPTHNKPIHPLLLEYLLKEVGFIEVQTIFTEASRTDFALPMIESDAIKNLEEVNRAIERISNFLYGSLDYAVIAKK